LKPRRHEFILSRKSEVQNTRRQTFVGIENPRVFMNFAERCHAVNELRLGPVFTNLSSPLKFKPTRSDPEAFLVRRNHMHKHFKHLQFQVPKEASYRFMNMAEGKAEFFFRRDPL
jgi:hypothetical protein